MLDSCQGTAQTPSMASLFWFHASNHSGSQHSTYKLVSQAAKNSLPELCHDYIVSQELRVVGGAGVPAPLTARLLTGPWGG